MASTQTLCVCNCELITPETVAGAPKGMCVLAMKCSSLGALYTINQNNQMHRLFVSVAFIMGLGDRSSCPPLPWVQALPALHVSKASLHLQKL
jgi:hypothetical protein